MAMAQTHISSALAAIMSSTAPLLTLLVILVFFREERPTRARILGLVIGLVGVLVVAGVWQGMGANTWFGIGAAVAANCAFAVSLPYTRRHLAGGPNASGSAPGLVDIMMSTKLGPIPFRSPVVCATIHG
jgi:drug/metabolite transporter (DMT)-like permease